MTCACACGGFTMGIMIRGAACFFFVGGRGVWMLTDGWFRGFKFTNSQIMLFPAPPLLFCRCCKCLELFGWNL
ncbi:hypothetical protein BZA05DRAFT_412058 [Tricharina praecox]|uniref:uncharacterized protein n=1 Tax=Tricharina praecox TaxID=43433 RepID=UPI00221E913E|nr:uncharacterized protein BZA05DRAFT_412058 [Tricharina praecox]KAI5842725.1 hypothetical protein BZA05DRAFT_412058 [Tricharina praecox]